LPLSVWISPCRAEKWARHPNTEDTWLVGEEPSTPDGLALRKPMVSASHYLSISHLSVANPAQVFSPVLTKEIWPPAKSKFASHYELLYVKNKLPNIYILSLFLVLFS
jgi:hypothetical protein